MTSEEDSAYAYWASESERQAEDAATPDRPDYNSEEFARALYRGFLLLDLMLIPSEERMKNEDVWCAKEHKHTIECVPKADPTDRELRLLRTLFDLCPDHDTCTPDMHTPERIACPHCGQVVYGTQANIDSGLRKHIDNYCPTPDE
jgi:hypothetical protein